MAEHEGETERRELLASAKRLVREILDRLDRGARDGSLDQSQMRMLESLALRALRFWKGVKGMDTAGRGGPIAEKESSQPTEDSQKSSAQA